MPEKGTRRTRFHSDNYFKTKGKLFEASMKSGNSLLPVKGMRVRIDFNDSHPTDVTMVVGDEVTLAAADDGRDGIVYQLTVLEFPTAVRIGDPPKLFRSTRVETRSAWSERLK